MADVVEKMFNELIEEIRTYHPSNDYSAVKKAYLMAIDAHGSQTRVSGEPYIIHPLSVAIILAQLELDLESIIAGILHDVIEDTKYDYNDIAEQFGIEIADIVDGLTKLEKIRYHSIEEVQAENYRKMFLAMAKDIRVIIIKIADRLHNMRTLQCMRPDKQKRIAQETLDIYAPLAHRLGISKVRYELEDLSFRYLNPDAYYELADKIVRKQSERQEYVNRIVKDLEEGLREYSIEGGEVHGRPKHFFSIYKKMVNQGKTLDQIYDLFAVRVIVETMKDCYEVLGMVHEKYTPVPGRFKDYIALKKSNMYQSLHNTLIGPEGEPFEIQIRTYEMHRTAEYGIAAHWKYKSEQNGQVTSKGEEEKLAWLRQILEWQRDFSDNREYLLALKGDLNIFSDHVYCFTPKGKVISLLNGATPIDFAYNIHSAVGNNTIGARVNGSIVPLEYILKNGDRVEILTSQNSKGPSQDWLKIVKTNQAKSKINQWFKKLNKEDNILRGKELLDKDAKKKGLAMSDLLSPDRIKTVLNKYSMLDWDSLCAAVGHGAVKEAQVINRLNEEYQKEIEKNITAEEILERHEKTHREHSHQSQGKKSGIVVKGLGDVSDVRLSKCCSPVPGDEIIGYITRGRGLSVHRTDCVNIINLDEIERQRLVEIWWDLPDDGTDGIHYYAEFLIQSDNRNNLVKDISLLLADEDVPITTFNARTGKDLIANINVGMEISSRKQLDRIRNKIFSLPGVHAVERVTT